MPLSKEEAVDRARKDLAQRLSLRESEVIEESVADDEFPDMALGASLQGELCGQMISRGWRIILKAAGKSFEYRANRHQVRLYNFKGANYIV